MKRIAKFLVATILLSVLLTSFTGVGYANRAADGEYPFGHNIPLYIGTSQILASLNIISGSAYCGSTLEVYSGYDGNLTMYLQRKSSNGYWITVTSWSGSTSGSNGVSLSKLYSNLISGATYRVHAVGQIYRNGNYIEQVSVTSPERTN